MKAYYVHWSYPASADDTVYYSGTDDKKLFHHKENAEKYAVNTLKMYDEKKSKAIALNDKYSTYGGTPTDEEQEQLYYLFADLPDSYSIQERDISFEDEE